MSSKEFYGRDYGTNLYVCLPCDARVGTHKNSRAPLGTLANAALRDLRMQCHKVFDQKWKSGRMSRTKAYVWLQERMYLSPDKAHIGMFDKNQCNKLLKILKENKS